LFLQFHQARSFELRHGKATESGHEPVPKKTVAHPGPMSDQTEMAVRTTLRRAGRCTTVLFTLAAWLVLSNHCLFGSTEATADPVAPADECPMHSASPAKQKEKPAAKIPCCKEIRAVVVKSITKTLTLAARSFAGQEFATVAFPIPPRQTAELHALDTGPPGLLSFAETVLQESMLAHAPPVS
jgi:hypothetical protein